MIKSCDKALADKNKRIQVTDLALKKSQDVQIAQSVQITQLEGQVNAWYHNPIFMVTFGLAVGAVTTLALKH